VRGDLAPGGRFPDLALPDHRGETVTLSKLANGYPLILSFYRGYW
jgi:peroxiredoxin